MSQRLMRGNMFQRDAQGQDKVVVKHICSASEATRLKKKGRLGGQENEKESEGYGGTLEPIHKPLEI